jgi:flavin-dependent dehydrogenase
LLNGRQDPFDLASGFIPIAPSYSADAVTIDRLRVGDALMGLDPLCGDGIGHGTRSAVLAVAVANSREVTVPSEAALAHFTARTGSAFRTHVFHCQGYYSSISHSERWRKELRRMQRFVDRSRIISYSPKLNLYYTSDGFAFIT